MQMAIDVADFTPAMRRPAAPGDGLQAVARADGGAARPAATRAWPATGSSARPADEIYEKLEAFADFGFAESHSYSLRVPGLRSARGCKRLLPGRVLRGAAGRAADGVLLAADAGRRRPAARRGGARPGPQRLRRAGRRSSAGADPGRGAAPVAVARGPDWSDLAVRTGYAVRLAGWASIRCDRCRRWRAADRRRAPRPYRSPTWPTWSAGSSCPPAQLEALATAGAFGCLGRDAPGRRCGRPGAVAQDGPGHGCRASRSGSSAPPLPGLSDVELAMADVWATGVSVDSYPTQFVRDRLDAAGVLAGRAGVHAWTTGRRVLVGGRRHPPAAAGDGGRDHVPEPRGRDRAGQRDLLEGGLGTVPAGGAGRPRRWWSAAGWSGSTASTNVVAERIDKLELSVRSTSRDFR